MRHALRRAAIATACFVAAAPVAGVAAPSPNPPCPPLFAQSPMVLSLDAMPPPVAAALLAKFRGPAEGNWTLIAPRDAEWQATDVITPGPPVPGRRFVGGGRRGTTWFVWYERGGIAHTYDVALFDLPAGARAPLHIAHQSTSLANLCAATLALLDGGPKAASAPDGGFW